MRITLFKQTKGRTFNHIPIYYNEAEEQKKERDRRTKEALGTLSDDEKQSGFRNRIQGKMRQKYNTKYSSIDTQRQKSNFRLIIILMVLMALAYIMLKSSNKWLEVFIK